MNTYLESLNFINDISLSIQDVTTDAEAQSGYKIVVVTYNYKGKSYTTKKLYYRNIIEQESVSNPELITRHYGKPVLWLDIEKHDWPHGAGAEIEQTVIDDMIEEGDNDFRQFLLSIANNDKNGHLQKLTSKGKSQMYGFNLENNNHWHDIILLLQGIIRNGGDMPPREAFINLVFNWGNKEPRERVKLDHTYKFIKDFAKSVKKYLPKMEEMEFIKILKYKKQIILQGPPGTGKTYTAKKIAAKFTNTEKKSNTTLTESIIKYVIQTGMKLDNASSKKDFYTVVAVDEKGVWIQSDKSQSWDASYANIIKKYDQIVLGEKPTNVNGKDPYEIAVAQYLYNNRSRISSGSSNDQVELIQFHPSYTYEDFVRGIEVQSVDGSLSYKSVNKMFGEFASRAQTNFENSQGTSGIIDTKRKLDLDFDNFIEVIVEVIDEKGFYPLTDKVNLVGIEEDAFRYKGTKGWSKLGNRMTFSDIKSAYLSKNETRQDIVRNKNLSGLANWHASYFVKVLNDFQDFIIKHGKESIIEITKKTEELKKFVLIIDEINRANLPSVLGELIYGLEYRGEPIQSMYTVKGKKELKIPENLYIIGTMNTADRSVGHIDYAIRRRFAFVDVLPKVTVIKNEQAIRLFKDVAALFVKTDDKGELKNADHLAPDFDYKDVQLGHSYFLLKADDDTSTEMDWKDELQLRLDYEIKPILREYLKDGILLDTANDTIEGLSID